MDTVIQRIAELERRCSAAERANRIWRAVALAVLTAGAAAIGLGAQQGSTPVAATAGSKTLECELLRIKKNGKTFAELEARKGGGSLLMCDATGNPRYDVGFADNGAARINIVGPSEIYQYHLSLGKDGTFWESIRDKAHESQISTTIEPNGSVDAFLRRGNKKTQLFGFSTQ
jgi:hypothetical protein